jgi:hypothetical protein
MHRQASMHGSNYIKALCQGSNYILIRRCGNQGGCCLLACDCQLRSVSHEHSAGRMQAALLCRCRGTCPKPEHCMIWKMKMYELHARAEPTWTQLRLPHATSCYHQQAACVLQPGYMPTESYTVVGMVTMPSMCRSSPRPHLPQPPGCWPRQGSATAHPFALAYPSHAASTWSYINHLTYQAADTPAGTQQPLLHSSAAAGQQHSLVAICSALPVSTASFPLLPLRGLLLLLAPTTPGCPCLRRHLAPHVAALVLVQVGVGAPVLCLGQTLVLLIWAAAGQAGRHV